MLDIFGHWSEQKEHHISQDFTPTAFLSIIISARNEQDSITDCLQSILDNDYPKNLFEIIVVDDHSEDNTAKQIRYFQDERIQVFRLAETGLSGKKQAIEYGISKAKGNIILVTDADCQVPLQWLRFHSSFYTHSDAQCVTGPIKYKNTNTLIERFQSLDLIGMMGVTQAGIFSDKWYMANGANMSFIKEKFYEVGAYHSSKQFASGDDIFLIQAIADIYPDKVFFLKNPKAAVITDAESTWKDLYHQRLRWGTKNKSYKQKAITITLGIVFIFCCSIVLNLSLIPFFGMTALFVLGAQLISKFTIDYFYLQRLNRYFNNSKRIPSFIYSSLIYIVYIVWIGIASLFLKKYTWKGRELE